MRFRGGSGHEVKSAQSWCERDEGEEEAEGDGGDQFGGAIDGEVVDGVVENFDVSKAVGEGEGFEEERVDGEVGREVGK